MIVDFFIVLFVFAFFWFSVVCSGFRVQGSRFRVQGSRFKVQGSRFKVQDSGFRVQGSGLSWRLRRDPSTQVAAVLAFVISHTTFLVAQDDETGRCPKTA